MTTKEILIAARAKIEAPERWTNGEFARSAKLRRVSAVSPRATCWCMVGTVLAVAGNFVESEDAIRKLREAISPGTTMHKITDWNDDPTRTHAEVLAAFDRAIAAAESV